MTSRQYRLRLHGLDSPSGTIRARELHEVLSVLLVESSEHHLSGVSSIRVKQEVF